MPIPFLEPFRIKMVESIRMTTREERVKILAEASLNVFRIRGEDVYVDMLTDSGTGAMSDSQWGRLMVGDESYAGARSFFRLKEAVEDVMGFPLVIPTHQGRGAESVLFQAILKPGQVVPNNRHFDTTQGNILELGGRPVDLAVPESGDPTLDAPFKGNMDIEKLRSFIEDIGPQNIPVGMLTITNNSAAGQPVSMANIRATSEVYRSFGIPVIVDACRFAENAMFIKLREPGYADKSIIEITREQFSYADGCTMSAKKDAIVNIGGFLALRDQGLYEQVAEKLILHEGYITYGGLAGRDLEAVAQGLREGVNEDYLRYRLAHTRYLGEVLQAAGIPVYQPTGGHAVYADAGACLPHIPPQQFPGVALADMLYLEGGVRACEIGSLMFSHPDPATGKMVTPPLEEIGEVAKEVIANPDKVRGVRIVEAPQLLRHFLAKMDWVEIA